MMRKYGQGKIDGRIMAQAAKEQGIDITTAKVRDWTQTDSAELVAENAAEPEEDGIAEQIDRASRQPRRR